MRISHSKYPRCPTCGKPTFGWLRRLAARLGDGLYTEARDVAYGCPEHREALMKERHERLRSPFSFGAFEKTTRELIKWAIATEAEFVEIMVNGRKQWVPKLGISYQQILGLSGILGTSDLTGFVVTYKNETDFGTFEPSQDLLPVTPGLVVNVSWESNL